MSGAAGQQTDLIAGAGYVTLEGTNAPELLEASQVLFVPEFISLQALFGQLLTRQEHFAVVVDEYGGTAGVVTVEDVVEQLVGDIAAASDHELRPTRLIALNTWQVDGDMSVHEWAEAFGQELVSPRVATVGM